MIYRTFSTRMGACAVVGEGRQVVGLVICEPSEKSAEDAVRRRWPEAEPDRAAFNPVVKQIRDYFRGRQVEFRVKLALKDATDFQRAVYRAAMRIPYGLVRTYGWLAKRIGSPRAARAVGNALGRNPVPIIVPCHRVVRSDGSLGGFSARQGVALKRKLLALEDASPTGEISS